MRTPGANVGWARATPPREGRARRGAREARPQQEVRTCREWREIGNGRRKTKKTHRTPRSTETAPPASHQPPWHARSQIPRDRAGWADQRGLIPVSPSLSRQRSGRRPALAHGVAAAPLVAPVLAIRCAQKRVDRTTRLAAIWRRRLPTRRRPARPPWPRRPRRCPTSLAPTPRSRCAFSPTTFEAMAAGRRRHRRRLRRRTTTTQLCWRAPRGGLLPGGPGEWTMEGSRWRKDGRADVRVSARQSARRGGGRVSAGAASSMRGAADGSQTTAARVARAGARPAVARVIAGLWILHRCLLLNDSDSTLELGLYSGDTAERSSRASLALAAATSALFWNLDSPPPIRTSPTSPPQLNEPPPGRVSRP